jgi:signal transduction histidine kinase
MSNLPSTIQPAGITKRITRLFYQVCLEVHAKSEDEQRKGFILNVILVSSILVLSVFGVLAIHDAHILGPAYSGIKISVFLLVYSGFLLSYVFSRFGYHAVSAYILVAMIFSGNAYSTYRWGIDVPDMLLSYAFLVVMAGIVISSTAAFSVTLAIACLISAIGWMQIVGKIPVHSYWRQEMFTFRDALEFSLYFLLIAAVSWLSNREIAASLRRALYSEKALKEERDQLEETVERRTRELHEAQAERIAQMYRFSEFGRLASGFFHDLSNPLMTLELYLDEIKNNAASDEIQNSHENIQKAIDVAKHIEVFTRSMQNQLRDCETSEAFYLAEEIQQVVSLSKHKLMSNQVSIISECEQSLQAFGNPLKFHQIILNLISNSIDAYGPPTAENSSQRIIKITLGRKDGQALLVIRDYACGIDQAIIAKMFEPFFTTKSHDRNTGLGLSITRIIVEKHFKGSIAVKNAEPSELSESSNEYSSGAEFSITIPLYLS